MKPQINSSQSFVAPYNPHLQDMQTLSKDFGPNPQMIAEGSNSDRKTRYACFSPDGAKDWLDRYTNPKNRDDSDSTVNMWTTEILARRWRPDADTIDVGWDGYLVNGHQRLAAIIKAGIPQWVKVEFNWDPELFKVADTNRPRSTGFLYGVASGHGVKYGSRLVAIVRNLETLKTGKNAKVSSAFAEEIATKSSFAGGIEMAMRVFNGGRGPNSSIVAAAFAAAYATDPVEVESLAKDVVNKVTGTYGSPAWRLHDYLDDSFESRKNRRADGASTSMRKILRGIRAQLALVAKHRVPKPSYASLLANDSTYGKVTTLQGTVQFFLNKHELVAPAEVEESKK